MANNDETISVEGRMVTETSMAWLVDCGSEEVWLPKSMVSLDESGNYIVPVWLAKKKGLVPGEDE